MKKISKKTNNLTEIDTNKINDLIEEQITKSQSQSRQNNQLENTSILLVQNKKKKGRKTKLIKMLEQEELKRNKVPIKLFPNLNEKIFDLVQIDGMEYFLDNEFGIVYNNNVEQVGIKKNDSYMFYNFQDIEKLNCKLEQDKKEIIFQIY